MKKISVLIVDDSDIDCYLLKRDLEDTEYEFTITVKHDGKTALDFFANRGEDEQALSEGFPPLIVFLDINMPLMDGLEFLEEYAKLRETDPSLQSTVVMMFTSSNNPKDIAESEKYSFVDGFLVKGEYQSAHLNQVIEKVA